MDVGWLSHEFTPPANTIKADGLVDRPSPKPQPTLVGSHMQGIRTDEQLTQFLGSSKPGTAVIEFGTSWCHKCHEMFPQFYKLTKKYSQHKYAVAQVETMHQTISSIKYTPTFVFYRQGKEVDEVVGKEPQRLEDHLWLHTD